MNIFDSVNVKAMKSFYEADTNAAPFVGEMWFPVDKQMGLDITMVKGKQGVGVALVDAGFDTNVLYRNRRTFSEIQFSLPFQKEAYKINEKVRQELLKVQSSGEEYKKAEILKVFNDVEELLKGAAITREKMRMDILATGGILINTNGENKNYDYGFNAATQQKTVTVKWDDATADVLTDFHDMIDAATEANNDVKPAYALCRTSLLRKLVKNNNIIAYFGSQISPVLPTLDRVKEFLENELDIKFILNDKKYIPAREGVSGTPVNFYPESRITLVQEANLGKTIFGTTPEEADLLGGQATSATTQIVDTGVAVTMWKTTDPVSVSTKVSQVVLPSCENIEGIYIGVVLAE